MPRPVIADLRACAEARATQIEVFTPSSAAYANGEGYVGPAYVAVVPHAWFFRLLAP